MFHEENNRLNKFVRLQGHKRENIEGKPSFYLCTRELCFNVISKCRFWFSVASPHTFIDKSSLCVFGLNCAASENQYWPNSAASLSSSSSSPDLLLPLLLKPHWLLLII